MVKIAADRSRDCATRDRKQSAELWAVLLAAVSALALVFLRDRPREEAQREALVLKGTYGALAASFQYTNQAFWLVSAAYFLGLAAAFALLFHQIAYLQELSLTAATAALAAGLTGLVGLPRRLLFPVLGDRVRPSFVVAVVFLILALSGVLLPGAGEEWQLYLYVELFGISFGAVLPMRAVIMGHHFSGSVYGRLMGLHFALIALATAGGSCRRDFARRLGELRPPLAHGRHSVAPGDPHHPRRRTQGSHRSYMKMSSGSRALTSGFGTSTVWLMRRSTAALHRA